MKKQKKSSKIKKTPKELYEEYMLTSPSLFNSMKLYELYMKQKQCNRRREDRDEILKSIGKNITDRSGYEK